MTTQKTKWFVVETPTELDIREVFTLGLTTKKGQEGKIGHKGSGLKFTLAYLHRLGSNIEIRLPNWGRYSSVTISQEIRGINHELILLDTGKDTLETHIDVLAGNDTWGEPWFILRELMQNAIDENGSYRVVDTEPEYQGNGTLIYVPMTEELILAWENRHQWYREATGEIVGNGQPGLFYHGFKLSSQKDYSFSYDVTSLVKRENISEDRQLRDVNMNELFTSIVCNAKSLPNNFYPILCDYALTGSTNKDIELLVYALYMLHNTNYPKCFNVEAMTECIKHKIGNNPMLVGDPSPDHAEHYYALCSGHTPLYIGNSYVKYLFQHLPFFKERHFHLPPANKRVSTVKVEEHDKAKLKGALDRVKKLRPTECKVKVVKPNYSKDTMKAAAWADIGENTVYILEEYLINASESELAETLVEEYMHLESSKGDGSIAFEKHLIKKILDLVTPKKRNKGEDEFSF